MHLPTAALRAEPDFIIIGVHKCGTTSLYAELSAHRQVLPAVVKEVSYFQGTLRVKLGFGLYRAHFPLRRQLAGPVRRVTGEATPGYIYSIAAADRIRDRLPNCKLLVVIRDPTDRAMSNYDNLWRRGQEERPIGQAIRSSLEAARTVTNSDVDACLDISNYVERGLYARFLGPWYERFPPEQILVVSLEELVADTRQTMAEVCEFIGIEPPTTDAPFAKRNDSREKHLDPTIVPELDEFYREPNRELADMLRRFQPERPLPPWLGDDHPR
ncbi:MAG: sulfotransferase domain-containing protein [Ilumatobacteraceae bacterium]